MYIATEQSWKGHYNGNRTTKDSEKPYFNSWSKFRKL